MERRDGFERQRLCVVPRPSVAEALARPVTRRLVVTDAGWFPDAQGHLRIRPDGAEEAIVLVCTRGAGWVDLGAGRVRVGPSSAALIPQGVPHSYGADDGSPWTIWWCHLRGTDLGDLWSAVGSDREHPLVSLRALDRVTALCDEIVSALERDQSPARLLATAGIAWRLMTQLAVDRRLPERGEPLERAMRYLEERVDGSIRVSELARLVGVSASHLGALFRDGTGGGVLAYHTGLKMARARRLLDTTGLQVSEIAREVGYDDPLYFSRQFSRVHGTSPSEYRALRKG
ncbi:helix-turn-helix domain-containing protein [Agromyces sp. CFH 90414]|uniref:Helix-turn-helix domain-containing protein n=1 Tax=Agromyces agglutinans TaxID=2662258 RepID=A0A6I2FF66_9MICO|nr:AraC family transcriptional regulator [Agromyces agglutinans]MRG61186.1 helix-turn-helix domain-containing protein [Agromyces agglutinans]